MRVPAADVTAQRRAAQTLGSSGQHRMHALVAVRQRRMPQHHPMTAGRKLYNFAAFQAGWFACVLGGAHGHPWLGPAAVAGLLAIHLWIARDRRGEWAFLAASIPLGLAVNTVLQSSGAVVAAGPATGPAWLLALWPLFASIFNESMSWMRGRYALGLAFGAVGAPLSYWGGERVGALELHERAVVWIALVVITWSAAMAALLWLQSKCTPLRA